MKNWRDNVRRVVPYVPGEQPNKAGMIKLNTNENPYPPAPGVQRVLEHFDGDALRLYPDPAVTALTETLAEYYGVRKDQVFVGVGSDDVLAMAFMTFFNSDQPILFPDISYSFYSVWAEEFRIPYKRPALDENFKLVKEDYYQENGGIIFPNPNAPTAIYEPLETIEDILVHNPGVVVIVDEAYIDFGGVSAKSLIEKYDNLLVVQTFSKSRSMAGMRIGFAMGNPELIQYLNDVKYSFNSYTMSRVAIECGVEAVTREWSKEELKKLGFSFTDSKANFIFATHEKVPAKEIFQALREANIYVRYFQAPRIDNYLRITIGTEEEMKALFEFLETYLNCREQS